MTKKELCDLKYKIDNLTNDERREIDKRLQQMIDEEENSLCSRRASSMYGRKFSLGGLNSPRHSSLSGRGTYFLLNFLNFKKISDVCLRMVDILFGFIW